MPDDPAGAEPDAPDDDDSDEWEWDPTLRAGRGGPVIEPSEDREYRNGPQDRRNAGDGGESDA